MFDASGRGLAGGETLRSIIHGMQPDADTIYESLWSLLESGAGDRRSAFHTPVLGTTDADGLVQVRTVVLRRVDRGTRTICCHTDRRSPKVNEIHACSRVSWLFYDASRGVQVRAGGTCRVHTGSSDAVACETWRRVHPNSRVCYSAPLAPSAELPAWDGNQSKVAHAIATTPPTDEDLPPDTFVVLVTTLESVEWLDLHHDGHHRVRYEFDAAGAPVPVWLAP